jgi:hypothetical protein
MSNPEDYLKNHASYGGKPNIPIDPEWEKYRATPDMLKAGVKRIVQSVGALSLQVATALDARSVRPNVTVDAVRYRNHWWRGKIEDSRTTVGSGWVLQSEPGGMTEGHTSYLPGDDRSPGSYVRPAPYASTGNCLLQDGSTASYRYYIPSEPQHYNPRLYVRNDFASGKVEYPYSGWSRTSHVDREEYASAILQVCGVEQPYDWRVLKCVYDSSAEEQVNAATSWMNRLEQFAGEYGIALPTSESW